MNASPDFESIKQINILGQHYWSARDLMSLLGYEYWQNFEKVIEKAKISAQEVGLTVQDHFSEVTKMIRRCRLSRNVYYDLWRIGSILESSS